MTNAHAYRLPTELKAPLAVAELFAGVGGFHLGLERARLGSKPAFNVVWGNQWEPSTKQQHAFDIYKASFPKTTASNEDISKVDFSPEIQKGEAKAAPNVDVLVGGFPCQDYSVARTLSQAAGIMGKKGVLWWQIHRFLVDKGENKPAFLIFENVDRLLKSPADQRGRDFAVLLMSLGHLGYAVEWRVINAAEYGFPQRRKRVFIVAHHEESVRPGASYDARDMILHSGVLARALPVRSDDMIVEGREFEHQDLPLISEEFNKNSKDSSPFRNAGFFRRGRYWTMDVDPVYTGTPMTLRDVLVPEDQVPEEFYIPAKELKTWRYLKGAKNEERIKKSTGFKYFYTEGPIAFPDHLDRPSRTIITAEGGRSPSRFKHLILVGGRHRRLMPIELERLNGFPDNHTAKANDGRRAFMMGNALIVGIVERIGQALAANFLIKNAPRKASSPSRELAPAP